MDSLDCLQLFIRAHVKMASRIVSYRINVQNKPKSHSVAHCVTVSVMERRFERRLQNASRSPPDGS